jgi:small subunit ribosomal protein S8e
MKKRRNTGGKRPQFTKKRKYQLGRQSAQTKLGEKIVRPIRTMGGNRKFRALRLEIGNFSWGSEGAIIIEAIYA